MGIIIEPKTKKAKQTKNKIIEKGFELICRDGYYNITSVDIAKYAGVSIGIIYKYFNDKNDILTEGVRQFSNKIMSPMVYVIQNKEYSKENLPVILDGMIEKFVEIHRDNFQAHEQLIAMCHLNPEIKKIMLEEEYKASKSIEKILSEDGKNISNIREKVYVIVNLIDNYCHAAILDKNTIDCEVMKKGIINTIIYIIFDIE